MSQMSKVTVSGSSSDQNDCSNVFLSQTETIRTHGRRVIRSEKWKCPLESGWRWLGIFGVGHQGVVVTLEDGKTRFLVHKLPTEVPGKGDAILANASAMGSNWIKFDAKEVKNATLGDYLHECGDQYYISSDNCIHAVNRMWKLS